VRSWRLLDHLENGAGGAQHMEADLALLAEVVAGADPALRLYRFVPPALSLGRFQDERVVDHEVCRRLGVEVVRRPTGGKALLHGAELTYAVAIPRPDGEDGTVDGVYCVLANALIAGLARLGVTARVARHDGDRGAGPACITSMQGADLRVGDRKVCGSAQLRRRGAVLQHGSILLDRLGFDETFLLVAPGDIDLRGASVTMRELGAPADPHVVAGALIEGFRETLDVDFR
jgi:lipoate-protein ligase A